MRRAIIAISLLLLWICPAAAEEALQDPSQLFYKANALYEKRDYEEAAAQYQKILESDAESGPLYYNLGNAFFKMGKTGDAILSYRRALKLMPGDSDLKSNLNYAQSLTEDSALQAEEPNRLLWLIRFPFREISLNAVTTILIASYGLLIMIAISGIISPILRRKLSFVFYPILLIFLAALAGFGVRYYDEEVVRRGIVVVKEVECKYEPIEKSTTYYTLKEGQEALVLTTRNGWRRIRRLDGKLGWVKSDAVEEID